MAMADSVGFEFPASMRRISACWMPAFAASWRRVIPRAGHNLPQEVPGVVTEAALELIGATR